MSRSTPHKEPTWSVSPPSATYTIPPTSPHYVMPQISDDIFRPVYDPQEPPRERTVQDEAKGYQVPSGFTYGHSLDISTRQRPWWMFGFEKWSSVGLFIFFGGAILGFSLARTPMLSFKQLLKLTTPGEDYWYEKSPWKANIIIHCFTSLPSSFFSVFCFLPITWKRWPRFHGILGYIVSVLLVISCVCGAVIGRRGQGGDINTQCGVYMLASAAAYAVIMGCVTARRGAFDAHREWMLRAWFYNGAFVTTRVTALLSAQVITVINSYYSLWRCAEVGYVLKTAEALAQAFPQCATPGALADPTGVYVAVHSSWNGAKLGKASAIRASFGMSLWVAMILHFVGIELYLRMTLDESKKLRELSEQRANAPERAELPHRMSR